MGYDKPDLAFCIHVGSPASPVAYYQQVGRAGRALADAVAVLLPAETDAQIWAYFATAGVPDEDRVGKIVDALAKRPQTLVALETATANRRGRLEGLLKILAVDEVVKREGSAWALTGTPWRFDAERWRALAQVREREAGLMRAFAAGTGCLMRFLQQALDDPDPSDCGRCSVCTGRLPGPGARPGDQRVEAARAFARGSDVTIEPRKLWPAGGTRKGRIVGCSEGRALAFADDPGWADALLPLFNAPDGPASAQVLDGVVVLLGRWRRSWGDRPVAVVAMPSASHPQLVRSVASHVAVVGRLPLVDAAAAGRPVTRCRHGVGRDGGSAGPQPGADAERVGTGGAAAAGRRPLPQRLADDRCRRAAARSRCDRGAATGPAPAALSRRFRMPGWPQRPSTAANPWSALTVTSSA